MDPFNPTRNMVEEEEDDDVSVIHVFDPYAHNNYEDNDADDDNENDNEDGYDSAGGTIIISDDDDVLYIHFYESEVIRILFLLNLIQRVFKMYIFYVYMVQEGMLDAKSYRLFLLTLNRGINSTLLFSTQVF